jgi:hypothetical protein
MKCIAITLLLTIFYTAVFSQDKNFVILGKVIDSASRQPLPGASAFCQSTTQGTVSNNDGLFFMRLPNGGYDLVISYTGYEKRIIRISNNQASSDTMLIELVKAEQQMAEVAVTGSTEVVDGWVKYGQFFTDNFIGTTPNSNQCKIENPESLHFFYTKKRNRLRVTSKEDLVVINYALGYKIRYQLDSFSFDYNTNISQFTGSPLFQEIDTTAEVKTVWKKNRVRTYLGSRLHFMRSLYDSSVTKEGFVVEKMDDDLKSGHGTIITELYKSDYYSVDSGDVVINWVGQYRISYRDLLPDKKFLQEYKLPSDTRSQFTILEVPDGFVIEENGYFYEQYDVINNGYWAWKKLAELLPYDYKYE